MRLLISYFFFALYLGLAAAAALPNVDVIVSRDIAVNRAVSVVDLQTNNGSGSPIGSVNNAVNDLTDDRQDGLIGSVFIRQSGAGGGLGGLLGGAGGGGLGGLLGGLTGGSGGGSKGGGGGGLGGGHGGLLGGLTTGGDPTKRDAGAC